ncbi:MAG: ATP-binding protein [Candidatus Brockarchaeota archaeon]|nr:ATP-binding protein [Candidatus Brockarchaeota archaeon]
MNIILVVQLFVNREEELRFLEERHGSMNAELVVVYGRRRIGKTELLARFIAGKPAVYFLADRRPERDLLQEFKVKMAQALRDESFSRLEVGGWLELFEEFLKWWGGERIVIVIDEFPTLIEGNKAVPSVFQKIWDLRLKDSRVMLVLLGSSVSMMETEVLGYRSPLYGRRTGQWKLQPLRFQCLGEFFPKYGEEDLVRVYGCLGGVPAYLLKFDPNIPFWENLATRILRKGEFLYGEAEFLLREELREPRFYSAILRAVALGASSFGEIAGSTGLEKTLLSKYLDVLEELGWVERLYPVGERIKPRKALYRIADPYMAFWFRYVFPNKSDLELNDIDPVLERIKRDYDAYLGAVYEQLFRESLRYVKNLPIRPKTVGRWWFKDQEIDAVALDEAQSSSAFFEVKWSNLKRMEAERVIQELKKKAQAFKWRRKKRREYFGLFAKRIEGKEELSKRGYIILELKDILRKK